MHHHRSRSIPALARRSALTLAVLGGTWALASTASAAVPGLQLVTKTSPSSSFNKSEVAICPGAKRLLGGGGTIAGGLGEVVLDDLTPGTRTFLAFGREDQDGLASNWSIRAFAICADPVPGLELVSTTGPTSSFAKSTSAACPTGKQVVSTGGEITGGNGQVSIFRFGTLSSLRSVRVSAREDRDGFDGNWSVRAHAICANPLPGLELVTAESAADSFDSKSQAASCPSGKKVVGGGAEVGFNSSEAILKDIHPSGNLSSIVASAEEDQAGSDKSWSVRAHAICATA